jgi:hypothetical protein
MKRKGSPMRSRWLSLALAVAAAALVGHASSASAAGARYPRTAFFDAIFTSVGSAGPDGDHVGHQQIVSGVLRNAAGRRVGRPAFTFTWMWVLSSGHA